MDVQTCPHCSTRVLATAEGMCPSCRQVLYIVAAKPPIVSGSPFAEMAFTPTEHAPLKAEASNPYAAPQFVGEARASARSTKGRSGLFWILFSFEGRIPRRVFWAAYIGSTLGIFAAIVLVMLAFGPAQEDSQVANLVVFVLQGLLLWTSLAIRAKRWHDRNKAGWMVLIEIIPLFGAIYALIETGCLRGTVGPNRYGPDPT